MSTLATNITQLSVTFPPVFTTTQPNIDPFISSHKNVLSIELYENEKHLRKLPQYPNRVAREDLTSNSVCLELEVLNASQGPIHIGNLGRPFRGSPEDLERNTLLIHRIRKLVSEDAARQPEDRIDCVEIGPDPWPEHLRALDGLSPKHLRVDAGIMEEIDVIELDNLSTKFKLESLCISSVVNDWLNTNPSSETPEGPTPGEQRFIHRFPEFLTHVKSLTLNWCHNIFFEGTNLPTHLRQLKIIGNNAMDMFIFAVDHIPNASEQLENVFIYTDPQYDMSQAFWLNDFRERLGRCKGLKELTLIVADHYEARATRYGDLVARYPGEPEGEDASDPFDVALSRSLPNSIERLEFHCSNSEPMLADLDLWIEAAKDPAWLPCLKSIHIRTYDPEMDKLQAGEKQTPTVNAGRDKKISESIQRVYAALKKREPPVEVSEAQALALQYSS
jgi:hypothetical protein